LQPVTGNVLLLRHAVRINGSGRLESILTKTAHKLTENKAVSGLVIKEVEGTKDWWQAQGRTQGRSITLNCDTARIALDGGSPYSYLSELTGQRASRRCSSTWLLLRRRRKAVADTTTGCTKVCCRVASLPTRPAVDDAGGHAILGYPIRSDRRNPARNLVGEVTSEEPRCHDKFLGLS
jgi:hypothetical protein